MSRARDLLAVLLFFSVPVAAFAQGTPAAPPASAATVENGYTVKLEYTLKDDAGTVIDTNKGQEPLSFTQGGGQLMPGLEKQLVGMHTGDEKKVVLKPEDAYGPSDPAAQAEVPKNVLPPEALTVGTRLMARNSSGEARPVTVKEIKEETVVLDLNHPLAGKTLVFEVKVLGIEPAKASDAPSTAEPPKASEQPKPAPPKTN